MSLVRRIPWKALALTAVSLALIGGLLFIGAVMSIGIPEKVIPQATRVLDANGHLVAKLFVENRQSVPLSRISVDFLNAVVAIEDERFYQHLGLDFRALVRAFISNLRARRVVEGGSTITQQLAKNLYTTAERTLGRKLYEAILTVRLETQYTKEELLQMYVNTIYLGHGAFGVETASQIYFGKHASELTLGESALLAGLIRLPEYYTPYKNAERAAERRSTVLRHMLEQGYIIEEQRRQADSEEVRLVGLKPLNNLAPYFVQYVIEQLTERHPEIASDLYTGGYTIITALDVEMQKAANSAFAANLQGENTDEKGVLQPQGALVAIDPTSGYIKALIGGRSYSNSQFNRAVQAKRQPGSAFKPFMYTAVLDSGYTIIDQQVCEHVSYPDGQGGRYEPTDYKRGQPYHNRPMDIREAVAISDNVVAVRWNETIAPRRTVEYARRMGITSRLEASLPLVLGASEVTPLELVNAYAPLANNGLAVTPISILRVINQAGQIVEENRPRIVRVLDERTAYLMTDVLKSVLRPGGTGAHLRWTFDRPAAGKTGTTENQRDAWFIGYTPQLVCGVYVGYDDPTKSLPGYGGTLAGPIWAAFMHDAHKNLPVTDFPRPAGVIEVTLCTETNLPANPTCPTKTELFKAGTEPTAPCPAIHFAPPDPDEDEPISGGEGNRRRSLFDIIFGP